MVGFLDSPISHGLSQLVRRKLADYLPLPGDVGYHERIMPELFIRYILQRYGQIKCSGARDGVRPYP